LTETYLDETAHRIRERVPASALPDDAEDLTQLFRLYALLVRVKGALVTASDVHDAWSAWMLGRGEDHASLRPYSELAEETRSEDEPFLRAILTVAAQDR
jgi:hypothetical protein